MFSSSHYSGVAVLTLTMGKDHCTQIWGNVVLLWEALSVRGYLVVPVCCVVACDFCLTCQKVVFAATAVLLPK